MEQEYENFFRYVKGVLSSWEQHNTYALSALQVIKAEHDRIASAVESDAEARRRIIREHDAAVAYLERKS